MITEFQSIFRAAGWEKFWRINEEGCRQLTIEFLCMLKRNATHVTFRIFGEQHTYTWKQFSTLLGFDKICNNNLGKDVEGFDKVDFWKEITDSDDSSLPRTNEIHNPTLCFMHRWISMTLYPRNDIRTVRIDEMKILYAMINRTHISRVICMIDYWMETFTRDEYVECTSLIIRIAKNIGLLDRALINYLTTDRPILDVDHFTHAHMMRVDADDGTLIMTYRGCVNEIHLPNMEYWLSNDDRLTILLETIEAYNHRIAGEMQVTRRMTRAQTTAAQAAARAQRSTYSC